MTEEEFIEFATNAASRATRNIGQIGHLICTQLKNRKEPAVREPEIRAAFQQEAEERKIYYGIEVPTQYRYRFSGKKEIAARTDFVLLASASRLDRDVLVEFKADQPHRAKIVDSDVRDTKAIRKDLHKLLSEPVRSGWCVFHVLHAADENTLPSLILKYNEAMHNAADHSKGTLSRQSHITREHEDGWHVLLVLILRERGQAGVSRLKQYKWDGAPWAEGSSVSLLP